MKEKFAKIESRLTFIDENYTNGWSLQHFFCKTTLKNLYTYKIEMHITIGIIQGTVCFHTTQVIS